MLELSAIVDSHDSLPEGGGRRKGHLHLEAAQRLRAMIQLNCALSSGDRFPCFSAVSIATMSEGASAWPNSRLTGGGPTTYWKSPS